MSEEGMNEWGCMSEEGRSLHAIRGLSRRGHPRASSSAGLAIPCQRSREEMEREPWEGSLVDPYKTPSASLEGPATVSAAKSTLGTRRGFSSTAGVTLDLPSLIAEEKSLLLNLVMHPTSLN